MDKIAVKRLLYTCLGMMFLQCAVYALNLVWVWNCSDPDFQACFWHAGTDYLVWHRKAKFLVDENICDRF